MMAQIKAKTTKTIPYIRELPILGSIRAFMKKDLLAFLLHVAQQGDACGFHIGPVPVILFNKPEHVQSILVEHGYDFGKGQLMHKVITGNGLFVSEGEFHRHQRKLIAPIFQPRQIASYADTIVQYGERIQQEWKNGEIIDLNQEMTSLTMSVIGKVLFDADVLTRRTNLAPQWQLYSSIRGANLRHRLCLHSIGPRRITAV